VNAAKITRTSKIKPRARFLFRSDGNAGAISQRSMPLRVIDDIADDVDLRTEEKRRRLDGWRESLRKARPNESSFAPDVRHLMEKYALTPEMLEEINRRVEMDLSIKRYQTFEDLRVYCYRVASAVGLVSIEIFWLPQSSL